jgi:hypothetical protein
MGLSESDLWNLLKSHGHKVSLNNIKVHRAHRKDAESSLQPMAIAKVSSYSLIESGLSLDEQQTRLLQKALEQTEILHELFVQTGNLKVARSLTEAMATSNRLIESRMVREKLPDPVIQINFQMENLEDKLDSYQDIQ